MSDAATPNLPSRDFQETSRFYAALGFSEDWRDAGGMILRRGDLSMPPANKPGCQRDAKDNHGCILPRLKNGAVVLVPWSIPMARSCA
jgi:hypothetical protein